jgi:cobalt-zinc-cadmium efflux system membrane fusion protein
VKTRTRLQSFAFLAAGLLLLGCEKKFDPASGAPGSPQVIDRTDSARVTVDHPEQFPLVAAQSIEFPDELSVTGSVNPDISREVPVISLASGRIVDIRARLDDNVKKGDLLAVPLSTLEQAQDAEADAKADLTASEQQLDTLGVRKDHPSGIVNVYAPISGVIVAQNVTNAAAAGVTYSGSATAFTIADLSVVWILCDIFENDLPRLHLGQSARIRINAYPDKVLNGTVSDIGPVLDPTLRTAKVRIEVRNPGNLLRLGMFATATLQSRTRQVHAVVPASAILHLHDRDWVFVAADHTLFQRIEVTTGDMLSGGRQVILSGILPNQEVVSNVLALEATLEAQ